MNVNYELVAWLVELFYNFFHFSDGVMLWAALLPVAMLLILQRGMRVFDTILGVSPRDRRCETWHILVTRRLDRCIVLLSGSGCLG